MSKRKLFLEAIDTVYGNCKHDNGYYVVKNTKENIVRDKIHRILTEKDLTNHMDLYITIMQYNDDVHIRLLK